MSYIQVFIQGESETAILADDPAVTRELDSEALSFAARLIDLVDDLDENDVLIIRKVIY